MTQNTRNRYNALVSVVRPALCALLLVACSSSEEAANETAKQAENASSQAATVTADADVTNVFAREERDATWTAQAGVR